ncbi:MAG: hypothetical protein KAR32_00680, partial [Candidatus Omnitrophica bacterium]|nr:hypothetical protein [Candidatus Omnitrophota bacterium]
RPVVTVTDLKTDGAYDNGLQAGTLYTNIIKWSVTGSQVLNVKIYYDDDNSGTFAGEIDVAGTRAVGDGVAGIDWTIPTDINFRSDVKIRVMDAEAGFTNVKEDSATFKTRGALELTAPIGGITWLADSTHYITWTYDGDNMDNIDIYYDDNSADGRTWDATTKIFPTVAASNGSQLWTVPKYATNTGAIRIEEIADDTVNDIGDVKVGIIFGTISPNGNETLYSEISSDITWEASGVTGVLGNPDVGVWYNNGLDGWEEVEPGVFKSYTAGKYGWAVPGDYNDLSNTNKIKLIQKVPYNEGAPIDVTSEDTFSILATITVEDPPGATNYWSVNTTETIKFTKKGEIRKVNYFYSATGDAPWGDALNGG